MPILSKTNRPTKKVILWEATKDEEEAWVEVYSELLMGEVVEISKYKDDPENASPDILTKIIKAWNFTDDDKKPLAITSESVALLPIPFVIKIMEGTNAIKSVSELAESQKKSSSSTSPLNTTEPTDQT